MSDFNTALSLLYSQISIGATSTAYSSQSRRETIPEMREYMRRIGISHSNKSALRESNGMHFPAFDSIIHITGTKGKGSTCSMCESIVRRSYGVHTGLFTSPHLVKVTERIRLDGQPISEQEFSDAYMEVRRRLLEHKLCSNGDDLPVLPGYFRMLFLVALFVFAHHKFDDGKGADVTILEVGMGGRYDATNVFEVSDVVGITLLDLDHTTILGDTLEKIAWEKGGIIKKPDKANDDQVISNCAFTVRENTPGAIKVLKECAAEAGVELEVVRTGDRVDRSVTTGLPGDHQRMNAELAVAVCDAWRKKRGIHDAASAVKQICTICEALDKVFWPGRCQTLLINNGNLRLRCDGAHTEKSVSACLQWFCQVSGFDSEDTSEGTLKNDTNGGAALSPRRILLFNCSHERNPVYLLQQIVNVSKASKRRLFHEVHFCPSNSEKPSRMAKSAPEDLLKQAGLLPSWAAMKGDGLATKPATWQDTLFTIWQNLEQVGSNGVTREQVYVGKTVQQTLDRIEQEAKLTDRPVEVLVTGSLYIVGSVLEAVDWAESSAGGRLVFQ